MSGGVLQDRNENMLQSGLSDTVMSALKSIIDPLLTSNEL